MGFVTSVTDPVPPEIPNHSGHHTIIKSPDLAGSTVTSLYRGQISITIFMTAGKNIIYTMSTYVGNTIT